MSAPLVVVSVLHWNTADATLRCLAALQRSTYPNQRIVLVDNASTEAGGLARIRALHPQLVILHSPVNRGYAEGHALALAQAEAWSAAALWLLNSDAEPAAAALQELVAAWQALGDGLYAGVPLHYDDCGRASIAFAARWLDRHGPLFHLWRRDRPLRYDARWRERAPFPVRALPGSCLLLPLAVARRHGWLDPAWFLYCEELDWCLRLGRQGVASRLVPQARVRHAGGGSSRTPALAAVAGYYQARNQVELARRHGGGALAALVAGKKLLRGLALLGGGRLRAGALLLRAVADALAGRLGKTVAPEAARAPPAPRLERWPGLGARLRARLRRLLPAAAPRCTVEPAGRGTLAWTPQPPPFLREYHHYCLALLRQALEDSGLPLALQFELATPLPPAAGLQPVRIGLQWEHTLVRPGGRDSAGALPGTVPIAGTAGHYLVRIADHQRLREQDLVIDYSLPNLANVESAGPRLADYRTRCLYLAPLLYDCDFGPPGGSDRARPLLSLFADLRQSRRAAFLAQARDAGLPLQNVRGVYAGAALRRLYRQTRILVNVHQTDHHHTAEELRLLPALACGVVIVSEDVPLRTLLPYHEWLVWAEPGRLLQTLQAVHADYAAHQARIFGDPRLLATLLRLQQDNRAQLAAVLPRLMRA